MRRWMFLGIGFGGLLALLAALSSREWGVGGSIAAVIYSVFVTVFLGAQVYAFVLTQVRYSEGLESPKFKILREEGIEPCLNKTESL